MSATDFGDPHQTIHIPARDLTGTREAKLADLDMFLAQLQLVRLALCGQTVRLEGFIGGPNEPLTSSPLTWSRPAKRLRAILDVLTLNTDRTRRGRS
jgi:hypothetical protein